MPLSLGGDCRAAAAKMLARLDGTFRAVIRPPFVVIGNLPTAKLEQVADGSVVRPARAMWASYFQRRPTDAIIALLLKDDRSYRAWAKKLFGDIDVSHFGYYRPGERTLVMNISTGTGTLVHELTHALIVYDFPNVPDWFNEGLASLHEQCQIHEDRVVGLVNWRLLGLQRAVRAGSLRPLRELLTKDDFYRSRSGLNYAQARYFVMYMQQRGLLRKFYKAYRARQREADSAVKCVESVFGRKLHEVEQDLLEWVKPLRWPR